LRPSFGRGAQEAEAHIGAVGLVVRK
jgi:hypothetical protein